MMLSILQLTPLLLAATLGVANPAMRAQDLNGAEFKPFHTDGKAAVLFFLSPDCPISKFYARDIQRLCDAHAANGVSCRLVFEDLFGTRVSLRRHLIEFGYRSIPAMHDESGEIAKAAGATITPQAVVVGRGGRILYRGRIDNYYADLGKPRQKATAHDLEDALAAIVAGRPVAAAETQAVGCYIPSPELLRSTTSKKGPTR